MSQVDLDKIRFDYANTNYINTNKYTETLCISWKYNLFYLLWVKGNFDNLFYREKNICKCFTNEIWNHIFTLHVPSNKFGPIRILCTVGQLRIFENNISIHNIYFLQMEEKHSLTSKIEQYAYYIFFWSWNLHAWL